MGSLLASIQRPAGQMCGQHERGSIGNVTDGAALEDGTRSTIDRRRPRPSCAEERLCQ
jgi:hypothetical protein